MNIYHKRILTDTASSENLILCKYSKYEFTSKHIVYKYYLLGKWRDLLLGKNRLIYLEDFIEDPNNIPKIINFLKKLLLGFSINILTDEIIKKHDLEIVEICNL
jgi:hypothetical protein